MTDYAGPIANFPSSAPVYKSTIVANTRVEVAAWVGASLITITQWIEKGWLPAEGPWTDLQIAEARCRTSSVAPRGAQAGHGTDSRWRFGCRCDLCKTAHNHSLREFRAGRAILRWEAAAPALIELLAAGRPYRDAADEVGVTTQAISAHRRRDPAFAEALDIALMGSRNPELTHGTGTSWKSGCRCPECREYHEQSR